MNRLMFTRCLRFLRRERRLWSPWKLWLANGGCCLPDRMTCCLLRWALKLTVGVSAHNFHSKESRNQEKCITREIIFAHLAQAEDVYFLVSPTSGFSYEFVQTSNTPRTIFRYVSAVIVINNNNNFKLKLQLKHQVLRF